MALDPNLLTALIGASAGILGSVGVVLAAKIAAKPAADAGLTRRFEVLLNQQRIENNRAQIINSRLEEANLRLNETLDRYEEWADGVVILVRQLGGEAPPKPQVNGSSHQGVR